MARALLSALPGLFPASSQRYPSDAHVSGSWACSWQRLALGDIGPMRSSTATWPAFVPSTWWSIRNPTPQAPCSSLVRRDFSGSWQFNCSPRCRCLSCPTRPHIMLLHGCMKLRAGTTTRRVEGGRGHSLGPDLVKHRQHLRVSASRVFWDLKMLDLLRRSEHVPLAAVGTWHCGCSMSSV